MEVLQIVAICVVVIGFGNSSPVFVEEHSPCPSLAPLEHGSIQYVDSVEWAEVCRVVLTCDPGYILSNDSTNLFCFYGEWVGDVPTCEETAMCPPLEPPMNGSLNYHGPHPADHIHSIVEVVCDAGHVVDNDPFLLCMENGQWSAEMPQCIPYSCGQIEQHPSWLTPTDCSALGQGYIKNYTRYDVSPTGGYNWQSAQAYCKSRNGDLAVTGMNDLTVREEIVEALHVHDTSLRVMCFGLQLANGTWTYLDGSIPSSQSIHWNHGEPDNNGGREEIALFRSKKGDPSYDLKAFDHRMDHRMDMYYALCEYNCA